MVPPSVREPADDLVEVAPFPAAVLEADARAEETEAGDCGLESDFARNRKWGGRGAILQPAKAPMLGRMVWQTLVYLLIAAHGVELAHDGQGVSDELAGALAVGGRAEKPVSVVV